MNETEAAHVMKTFSAVSRGFGAWRNDALRRDAMVNGTTESEEAAAMRRTWHKALAEYDPHEAFDVLEGFEEGRYPIPAYGEVQRVIASHCRERRAAKRENAAARRDERRFTCNQCFDVGHVTVYNPRFVEWLRPRFAKYADARSFPSRWYENATQDWYRKVRSGDEAAPAEVALACNCQCERALGYRKQLTAYREQRTKRAAFIGAYNPAKMAAVTFDPHADLTAWYAEHDGSELTEWTPAAGEYAARFGGDA